LRNGKEIKPEELVIVLKYLGLDSNEIVKNAIKNEIEYSYIRLDNPGIGKIPIKVTTIQSSKGLSADYVFIAYFDDQYFIKSGNKIVSDNDLRNFLVAFTRARKRVILISSDKKKQPTFLGWIKQNRIQEVN
ncbi:MAG: 3'-5' exonuclease, partial [bacterium]